MVTTEMNFLGGQFFDQIGGLLERQHGERLQSSANA
jgi:hypothetical protein